MMKIPLFCFILLVALPLRAQYDDLMKNPDISWVAEYTADFSLDPSLDEFNYFNVHNDLNVIQFGDSPGASGLFESNQNYGKYLSRKIVDNIRQGVYSFFEDELLEIPLPSDKIREHMLALDTIVSFDPETYEETVRIVRGDFDWNLITGFRVRQVFYYNKTNKIFGSRVIAIAPLMYQRDWQETMSNELDIPFWIKIDAPKNPEKITPKDVAYTFETKMRGNAPGLQDFNLKRGRMDFLQLIVNEVSNPAHPVFDAAFKPIEPSQMQSHVLKTDTVVSYNPETLEERIQILERNAIRDVAGISFVQQWYFDDRKNLMFNRVVAIAPVLAMKDGEGNIRFTEVLFYILNK